MIVWGGWDPAFNSTYNDGARFSPSANTWTSVAVGGAPSGRHLHSAVWTGSEMIIWGGAFDSMGIGYLKDGGRFSPTANTWTPISASGAPPARAQHTSVWTGSEMIVWGGVGSGGYLYDGSRYNPVANNWITTPNAGAPLPRSGHSAVWTGNEMVVWGGANGSGSLSDTASYVPVRPMYLYSKQ
jgi:N-acetylneuraminic acid mutarotase